MLNNFESSSSVESVKNKRRPDFPMPTSPFKDDEAQKRWQAERELKKSGLADSTGEYSFYMNNGELDKEWITNMWYGFKLGRGLFFNPGYTKPEDIEINSVSQLLHSINFYEIFKQSAAFKSIMSQPEEDSKRQKVFDFIADMVMRSINAELRDKLDNVPGLEDKIRELVGKRLQADCFRVREAKKIEEKGNKEEEQYYNLNKQHNDSIQELGKILEENNIN